MIYKEISRLRLKNLQADLVMANRLAEVLEVDHAADLRERVKNDLEQALAQTGKLSDEQRFWLAWAKGG